VSSGHSWGRLSTCGGLGIRLLLNPPVTQRSRFAAYSQRVKVVPTAAFPENVYRQRAPLLDADVPPELELDAAHR
jgi:hypothetical protein